MSKQIEHVQFVSTSTLSKGRNFTIDSFDIFAVCGDKVECCFDKVERCFDNVAGVDGALDIKRVLHLSAGQCPAHMVRDAINFIAHNFARYRLIILLSLYRNLLLKPRTHQWCGQGYQQQCRSNMDECIVERFFRQSRNKLNMFSFFRLCRKDEIVR